MSIGRTLADLDPELHGLAFGIPAGVLGEGEEHGASPVLLGPPPGCSLSVRGKIATGGQSLGPAPSRRYARAMCGRVPLSSDVSEIKLVFSIPPDRPTPNFAPTWNAAPTDPLPVVRSDAKAGERSLDLMRSGLAPFWAKDGDRELVALLLTLLKPALIPYSV
jgi:SOS response associated peptidase (SRAP)